MQIVSEGIKCRTNFFIIQTSIATHERSERDCWGEKYTGNHIQLHMIINVLNNCYLYMMRKSIL